MSKTIASKLNKRTIGLSYETSAEDIILIILDNSVFTPFVGGAEFDTEIAGMIQTLLSVGGFSFTVKGEKQKTYFALNVDNLTEEIFAFLVSKAAQIDNLLWLEDYQLYRETSQFPVASSNETIFNRDFSKALVKIDSLDWVNISSSGLAWDKYLGAKLESVDYTPFSTYEELDNTFTVPELDQLIIRIETALSIEIEIPEPKNKPEKINAILGIIGG